MDFKREKIYFHLEKSRKKIIFNYLPLEQEEKKT